MQPFKKTLFAFERNKKTKQKKTQSIKISFEALPEQDTHIRSPIGPTHNQSINSPFAFLSNKFCAGSPRSAAEEGRPRMTEPDPRAHHYHSQKDRTFVRGIQGESLRRGVE